MEDSTLYPSGYDEYSVSASSPLWSKINSNKKNLERWLWQEDVVLSDQPCVVSIPPLFEDQTLAVEQADLDVLRGKGFCVIKVPARPYDGSVLLAGDLFAWAQIIAVKCARRTRRVILLACGSGEFLMQEIVLFMSYMQTSVDILARVRCVVLDGFRGDMHNVNDLTTFAPALLRGTSENIPQKEYYRIPAVRDMFASRASKLLDGVVSVTRNRNSLTPLPPIKNVDDICSAGVFVRMVDGICDLTTNEGETCSYPIDFDIEEPGTDVRPSIEMMSIQSFNTRERLISSSGSKQMESAIGELVARPEQQLAKEKEEMDSSIEEDESMQVDGAGNLAKDEDEKDVTQKLWDLGLELGDRRKSIIDVFSKEANIESKVLATNVSGWLNEAKYLKTDVEGESIVLETYLLKMYPKKDVASIVASNKLDGLVALGFFGVLLVGCAVDCKARVTVYMLDEIEPRIVSFRPENATLQHSRFCVAEGKIYHVEPAKPKFSLSSEWLREIVVGESARKRGGSYQESGVVTAVEREVRSCFSLKLERGEKSTFRRHLKLYEGEIPNMNRLVCAWLIDEDDTLATALSRCVEVLKENNADSRQWRLHLHGNRRSTAVLAVLLDFVSNDAFTNQEGHNRTSRLFVHADCSPLDYECESLDSASDGLVSICEKIEQLAERLHTRLPQIDMESIRVKKVEATKIVVVARTSGGKSSFLNHVIGWPLLPTDKDICTGVPTELRFMNRSHKDYQKYFGRAVVYFCTPEERDDRIKRQQDKVDEARRELETLRQNTGIFSKGDTESQRFYQTRVDRLSSYKGAVMEAYPKMFDDEVNRGRAFQFSQIKSFLDLGHHAATIVNQVVIYLDHPLLRNITLVDTPGLVMERIVKDDGLDNQSVLQQRSMEREELVRKAIADADGWIYLAPFQATTDHMLTEFQNDLMYALMTIAKPGFVVISKADLAMKVNIPSDEKKRYNNESSIVNVLTEPKQGLVYTALMLGSSTSTGALPFSNIKVRPITCSWGQWIHHPAREQKLEDVSQFKGWERAMDAFQDWMKFQMPLQAMEQAELLLAPKPAKGLWPWEVEKVIQIREFPSMKQCILRAEELGFIDTINIFMNDLVSECSLFCGALLEFRQFVNDGVSISKSAEKVIEALKRGCLEFSKVDQKLRQCQMGAKEYLEHEAKVKKDHLHLIKAANNITIGEDIMKRVLFKCVDVIVAEYLSICEATIQSESVVLAKEVGSKVESRLWITVAINVWDSLDVKLLDHGKQALRKAPSQILSALSRDPYTTGHGKIKSGEWEEIVAGMSAEKRKWGFWVSTMLSCMTAVLECAEFDQVQNRVKDANVMTGTCSLADNRSVSYTESLLELKATAMKRWKKVYFETGKARAAEFAANLKAHLTSFVTSVLQLVKGKRDEYLALTVQYAQEMTERNEVPKEGQLAESIDMLAMSRKALLEYLCSLYVELAERRYKQALFNEGISVFES